MLGVGSMLTVIQINDDGTGVAENGSKRYYFRPIGEDLNRSSEKDQTRGSSQKKHSRHAKSPKPNQQLCSQPTSNNEVHTNCNQQFKNDYAVAQGVLPTALLQENEKIFYIHSNLLWIAILVSTFISISCIGWYMVLQNLYLMGVVFTFIAMSGAYTTQLRLEMRRIEKIFAHPATQEQEDERDQLLEELPLYFWIKSGKNGPRRARQENTPISWRSFLVWIILFSSLFPPITYFFFAL